MKNTSRSIFMIHLLNKLLLDVYVNRSNSDNPDKKISDTIFSPGSREYEWQLSPAFKITFKEWLSDYGNYLHEFSVKLIKVDTFKRLKTPSKRFTLIYPIGVRYEPTINEPEGTLLVGRKEIPIMAGLTVTIGDQLNPPKSVSICPNNTVLLLVCTGKHDDK